jgi:Transcriptional regulators
VIILKDAITSDEIEAIDKIWHQMIFILQKTSDDLWQDKLEGATTIEISILSIIEHKPDVILKEIGEILGVPASTLTSAVDRLEKRGLIRRTISKRDRRSFGLELTEDGAEAQIEHKVGEAVLWQKVLGAFDSAEERQELVRLLSKLIVNLNHL